MLESVATAPRETTAPPRPGTTLGGTVIATPAAAESGPQSGPHSGPRLGLSAGSAIEVRVVAVELPPGETAETPEAQIQGMVVEAAANSATLETASGRLELAVRGAQAGMRLAVATTEAPAPAVPPPLARDAIVAAKKPESGIAMTVRVVSVETPRIQGPVVEAAENRLAAAATEPESTAASAAPVVAVEVPVPEVRGTVVEVGEKRTVIETPSGRLSLALSAPLPLGTRVVAETVPEAPPRAAAAAPLVPQTVVAVRAETEIKVGQSSFAAGTDLALRINTIEPPAPRLLGTVVDSAAHRAVIETPAGRLTLALTGAALGARIEAEVVAPPPDPANPTASATTELGSLVAARAETALTLGRTIVAPQESLTLRIVSISDSTGEPPRLAGRVVASAEGRTRIETPIGELDLAAEAKVGQGLQLDVISRDAGVHRALQPATPEPLVPGRQVAAEIVGSGQPLVLRVVSLEAPWFQGTVIEASENRATVETASGRLELALFGAEPGTRITVATTDAPPPAAPVPLSHEAIVEAQPETGPALAVRVVSVEAPQLQGTVVTATESSAVIETASGRIELAVSGAEPGARITVATTDAPPPAAPVPLAREAIVEAQPETGPALAVRVVSVEAPQLQGTVVEASESRAVIETSSGRVELAVSGAEPGTRITVATTDAPPPAAPAPLAPEAIVMAQPETGPALAVRIVALEAPQLQGTVVEASENRATVETAAGRVELAVSGAEPGARITVATTDAPPPPAPVPLAREAIVAAQPETGPALAMRIVSVEAPQIQGTVVEASESRAVIETASGRVELAVSGAEPGTRITVATTDAPPPAAPAPLAPEAIVMAQPETGPALAVRIVALEAPQLQGTVVEASENRAVVETASGRLELAVSGAESGARITVAATDATPPATPVPLAREVVVAAQPETGPALAMRIISVEAPQPQGTVVEASESRAVIETASGRVELAVSGAEPGTRITVATTDAPPPAAPAPLAPEAIVMAQPETGPALAVRIVALEAPALRLRATVVAASENRAEVETPLGRLVLEATAEPGSRLDLEVLGPAAAAPRQPSGTIETGHQVAAEIVGSGQPLRLRVTAVEPPVPRLQGTVVEVAANSAVLETASGRLNLQLSTPPALGTLITVEIAETAPPAAPPQAALPLAIDQVVAARAETEITAAPAAVAAGSVLALRIAEIEAPAERLQGRVVDAGPQRVLVESDVGRLSLNLPPDQTPHELALGARIEAEIVPPETAPPAAENVVVARAESVLTTASTIVAPDQEFAPAPDLGIPARDPARAPKRHRRGDVGAARTGRDSGRPPGTAGRSGPGAAPGIRRHQPRCHSKASRSAGAATGLPQSPPTWSPGRRRGTGQRPAAGAARGVSRGHGEAHRGPRRRGSGKPPDRRYRLAAPGSGHRQSPAARQHGRA